MAQDPAAKLTVKEIRFKAEKGGKEQVSVLCTQTCVPALSVIEGNKPRIVMDFAGVSFFEPKYRNVRVSGKHVKKIRGYLNKDLKELRIVLDMSPSKQFMVRSAQNQGASVFSLDISETRPAKGKAGKTKGSRIFLIDRVPKPFDKAPIIEKTAEKQEPVSSAPIAAEDKSKTAIAGTPVELGRSQMNAGDYKGAIQTFTRSIAENPKDSLAYRLRGNAYQNIGEREKAIEDWRAAAKLGDPIIQSYLDHIEINWKEAPKK